MIPLPTHHPAYEFAVESTDEASAAKGARELGDDLRETLGVLEVGRRKSSDSTMDLGAILTIIASSGATLAIARGIADWLRRTRTTRLKIERDPKSGSIKAEVENIDPASAVRITEIIRGA